VLAGPTLVSYKISLKGEYGMLRFPFSGRERTLIWGLRNDQNAFNLAKVGLVAV
jgi:hypothetical protein